MPQTDYTDHHDYGYEVPPCSRKELICQAHAMHTLLGYRGDEPFPILKFAECTLPPRLYDDYSFDIVSEKELGELLGKTQPNENIILIREDVYDAAAAGQGFARMVVAHECGHLMRHKNIPCSSIRHMADRSLPAYKSSEWQANALAGALLMPASKIVTMNADNIVTTYKVSQSAARNQLRAIREEAKKWQLPKL